jgi:hypothetical protein
MDFQFQRGRKKPRTENRRRSLFRTPPKLREQAGESVAAEEPRAAAPAFSLAGAAAASASASVAAPSETLGKRQRPEGDGGLGSADLPDGLRLNKLIDEAVQNGLKMIPVRAPRCWLQSSSAAAASQPPAHCVLTDDPILCGCR